MASTFLKWMNKGFPKNFILKKPFRGTLILAGFIFFFSVLYRPFHFHGARSLSFGLTFAFYNLILFIPLFGCLIFLNRIRYFSKEADWTLMKEILSILIMLFCTGVSLYFAGFIIEGFSDRWNLTTFWGSVKYASLIEIIPFMFFTISNYRFLISNENQQHYKQTNNQSSVIEPENVVHIGSQLRKEVLSFYPSQFIFAESDGNYVIFHLIMEGQQIKKTIRNSINEIEIQLSSISYVMRIHRAFIVNLKKVVSKKGNTLGYSLKLSGLDNSIPVSRNNTRSFDKKIKEFL
jgi:hypothetical protein